MSNIMQDLETPSPQGIEFSLEEIKTMQRAIVKLFALWKLPDAQATTLLGGIPISEFCDWQKTQTGLVKPETSVRMSNLIGIHKCLRTLFREPDRGYSWIKEPNTAFKEQSALDVMMGGRLEDITKVRHYLSAVCAT